MKLKQFTKHTISFVLSFAMVFGMVSVPGFVKAEVQETVNVERLRLDVSGISSGVISTGDTAATTAINSKFYVYNAQRANGDSCTSYFERNNVNGYLVDDQAQNKPRYPDTAAFPAWNLDGWTAHISKGFTGNEDKPVPLWRVDGKWLTCDAYSGSNAFLFRETNLLYAKNSTPSGFASLENFTTEMSFKFKPLSDSLADGSDALVFVIHATSAGQITDPYQTTLAFNPNGQVYIGSLGWTGNAAYNDTLKDAGGNAVNLTRDKEYKLSLTVRNGAIKLCIYDGETLAAEYESSNVKSEGGLFAIGGSNAGAYMADIVVTREDKYGNAVDFSEESNGYGFGFDPKTFCTWRTLYYADNGSGTADTYWENYYIRNNQAMYWMNFWNNRRGNTDWLGNGYNTTVDFLNNQMGIYYEQIGNSGRAFQRVSFNARNGAEVALGAGTAGQQTYIANGSRLLALNDRNDGLLKESTSFTPMTADGNEAQFENVETQFSTILISDNTERATAVSLRSQKAGAMVNDTATAGYDGKITVLFSGKGVKVYDGVAMPLNGSGITYTPFNNGAVYNGVQMDVTVRLVGNQLYIKAMNGNAVCYEDTVTVNTSNAGYFYYTGFNGWTYFSSFKAAQLDLDGNKLDWNYKVGGVSTYELSKEGLFKTVGHAGFVGTEYQMDWTNSGFEISGNISGDVNIIAKRTGNDSYVDVIVDDGGPTRVKVPLGTSTVRLVSGLSSGYHTVRVISANSPAFGTLSVSYIEYTGALEVPRSNYSKLRILAIGDSITAGFGLNGKNGDSTDTANKIETSDGYYSYAAVAAREMDAELSVVANEATPISEVHQFVNLLNRRDGAPNWDWTKDENDIIVINLGTNDEWIPGKTAESALADAKALLEDMRAKNADAEIIWVYGMMRKSFEASYKAAVQYMNEKGDDKVYILEMVPDTSALEGHPSAAAHEEYGNQLAEFIRQNCADTIGCYTEHRNTIKSLADNGSLVINGRNKWNGTALASTLGAAGFTIKGDICDDVELTVEQTGNMMRIDVIVDNDLDNMKTIQIEPGSNTVKIAENLTRGLHSVQVRRAASDTGQTDLQAVKYYGTLVKVKSEKIQMEFLGDSITVGDGMLWTGGVNDYILGQNAMLGYAAKTAAKLGADFSMIAHSGITTPGMVTSYANTNEEFTLGGEKKDIVVINLGTNDIGLPATADVGALRASIGELIDAVIARNGEDVCIVWAYGMMATKGMDVIRDAVEAKANGRNIWFCDLSAAKNNDGCGEHPALYGNEMAAEILANYITDNCINTVVNGDINNDGVTDILDLVRYKKYLSGMDVLFESKRSDLNRDGKFDALDLATLRKNLLGIK